MDRGKTLDEIAQLVGGTVVGNGSRTVAGVAPPDDPREDALCVVWDRALLARLPAGVPVLAPAGTLQGRDGVETADPRGSLPALLPAFVTPRTFAAGVHPSAVVDPSAVIDPSASIGPLCVVGAGTTIGARAVLEAQVYLGRDVAIGEDSRLEPQVVLCDETEIGRNVLIHSGAILGCDGFGFIPGAAGAIKIPQTGRVVIEDDVEIGPLNTIDRATIGETRIGRGTKTDDHVHVGHNSRIGAHNLLVAFTGLAGSVTSGDGVVFAAKAGVNPHVTIGAGATVGGAAGVTTDVPPKTVVSGFPAQEHRKELRLQALIRRLPELFDRVKALE